MSRFITSISYEGVLPTPQLNFSDGTHYAPINKACTLAFDTTVKYCIGWHDLDSGHSYPCPENATVDKKYPLCAACQNRTGFNPAFYNSSTVSAQQTLRNAKPHNLYLAYMGENYIKVGISWKERGIKRLLEQGARAGLILDTFPSAAVARHHEAQIAKLQSIHETTSTRTKFTLLNQPYDDVIARTSLLNTKNAIEKSLSVSFTGTSVFVLDESYSLNHTALHDVMPLNQPKISGNIIAFIGDILIARYQNRHIALALKRYMGYPVTLTNVIDALELAPQQERLF